jgi:hypothetical protein
MNFIKNSEGYRKKDYQDHFTGNATTAGAYANISKDTHNMNRYHRSPVTATIAASTTTTNI